MATNQLRIDGLAQLQAALKALPPELVRESAVIVQAQADEAMRQMAAAYPVRRGALVRGLQLETSVDAVSATARVRNRARHAYIFEHRSKAERKWKTGKSTGWMPAGNVFIPIAIQRRRIMLSALVDLVERAGFTVTGVTA